MAVANKLRHRVGTSASTGATCSALRNEGFLFVVFFFGTFRPSTGLGPWKRSTCFAAVKIRLMNMRR